MYHRFHAPCDARVREVVYVSGDTWNVNPIALKRVERLFCKNERALVELDLGGRRPCCSCPSPRFSSPASACTASRNRCASRYRGPNRLPCDAAYAKGDEMGWFEHGSTILVFGTKHFALCDGVREDASIEMGMPLLRER